jgi:transcription antitermination protein NusB
VSADSTRAPAPRPGHQARSVARLGAVQALYQMEVAGAGVEAVVREFSDHRFGGDIEGQPLAEADEAFFADIVRGVVSEQVTIDALIRRRLAANWKLERLDSTVRAMLRAGAWELLRRPETPTEVVIDEYVELAKAFVDAKEQAFVNGALDAVARDARAS